MQRISGKRESLPDQHYGQTDEYAHPNGEEGHDHGLFNLHDDSPNGDPKIKSCEVIISIIFWACKNVPFLGGLPEIFAMSAVVLSHVLVLPVYVR